MVELDKDNFETEVMQSELPVVVDLWGPKCGPCLALLPLVENRRLVISLKVMGVPTFLFYKGGEQKDRLSGGDVTIEGIRQRAEALLA